MKKENEDSAQRYELIWQCQECKHLEKYIPGDALIFYGKERSCQVCKGLTKYIKADSVLI